MPAEIDARQLLAAAFNQHRSGTFLAIGHLKTPCGEVVAPALELVRDPDAGDAIGGDAVECLKIMQAALTHPVGGVLAILQVGETFQAWCWQLLAGAAIPMSAEQTDYFVRRVLKFRTRNGEKEVTVEANAGYPIEVAAE